MIYVVVINIGPCIIISHYLLHIFNRDIDKSDLEREVGEMAPPVLGGIIPPPMPYQVMGMPLMDPNMMIPQVFTVVF